MTLTQAQCAQFESDGFVCPIEILDEQDAASMRRELERIEKSISGDTDREAAFRNDANWVIPLFDGFARHPRILDAIEALLGRDILALHVDVFIKEPGSPDYVSWHQDLHYWGLDSSDEVTAWLALSPATETSGCMRFLPGSHKEHFEHEDTFASNNILTRGQAVIGVDEERAVCAELVPGQMSLHHGKLLHASGANKSSDRRIGIAIRYITPEMRLANDGAKIGASLVRGLDRHGNFELLGSPRAEFEPSAMRNWRRLREIEEAILYAGVDRATPE